MSGEVLRFDSQTGAFIDVFASGAGLVDPIGLLLVPSAGDYTVSARSVVIEAGSLSGSITLSGVADDMEEGAETVIINVSDVINGTHNNTQPVVTTIVEEDANTPPFTEADLADVNVNEDAADSVVVLFPAFGDLEDADADLSYLLTGNTNPTLFSNLIIDQATSLLTIEYAANANGSASLTVKATDSGGLSVSQTFDVNVAAINDTPMADPTTLNTNEDTAVHVDLRTLVDDVETAGIDLIFSVDNAVNGTIELLGSGYTARFTPTDDYNGPASFTYTVTDTGEGSDPAIQIGPVTLDVNIAAVNDAPNAQPTTLNTNEDAAVEIDLRTLVDDIETVDDDFVFSVDNAVNGSIQLLADGYTARFSPTGNYNGPASFTYSVTDTGDGSDLAVQVGPITIDINVAPINDAPIAQATTLSTNENTAVDIDLRTLVTDVETAGDDLIFSVYNAVNGTIELLPDGYTARFTPVGDYHGPASFAYEVTDAGDGSDEPLEAGPITIEVLVIEYNTAPFVERVFSNFFVDEDSPDTHIELFPYFGDMEDADTELVLTVTNYTSPDLFNKVEIDPTTGVLTIGHVPDAAGRSDFTIRATDTEGLWVEQTFRLYVEDINDLPIALPTTLYTDQNTAVEIDLRTLVDDVETPDDDFTFVVDNSVNGTVELLLDGYTARFTPANDYNGPASFDYYATDSGIRGDDPFLTVGPITIDVIVTDNITPPFVEGVLANINVNEDAADSVVSLFPAFGDLEDADADLSYIITDNTNPALFSNLIIDQATGLLTIEYAANANGTTSLTIQATDSGGLSVSQTFDVNVAAINDTPNADSTTLNTNEDTAVEIDLRTLVTDVETADEDLVFSVNNAVNGTIELLPDGHTARFTPTGDYNGPASFDYEVADSGDGADPAIQVGPVTIDVNIAAINDTPNAETTTLNTNEDTAVEIDLRTLVTDVETADDNLTFAVDNPVNGSIELLPDGHTARFTPTGDYNGPASFAYEVVDTGDGGDSSLEVGPIMIDVIVAAVNDTPGADSTTLNTNEDTAVEIDLRTLVDDLETADDDLIFSVYNAINGSIELLPDGHTARFTPTGDYNGPASFTYSVTDTGDGADPAIQVGPITIDVIVAPVDDLEILGITVNDGDNNRSNVRNIAVTFSDDTNLQSLIDSGEIVDVVEIVGITNSPGSEVSLSANNFVWDADLNQLLIDLTVDGFGGSNLTLLSDDNYQLQINADDVLNPNLVGAALVDNDGFDNGQFNFDFHRLLGDVTGDGTVQNDDLMKLISAFGQMNPDADTNGDDVVNILDFWSVYGSMGNTLPDEVFAR